MTVTGYATLAVGCLAIGTASAQVQTSWIFGQPSDNGTDLETPPVEAIKYTYDDPACIYFNDLHALNMLKALDGYSFGASMTATIDHSNYRMCSSWATNHFPGCLSWFTQSELNADGLHELTEPYGLAYKMICVEQIEAQQAMPLSCTIESDEWNILLTVTDE